MSLSMLMSLDMLLPDIELLDIELSMPPDMLLSDMLLLDIPLSMLMSLDMLFWLMALSDMALSDMSLSLFEPQAARPKAIRAEAVTSVIFFMIKAFLALGAINVRAK